MIGMGKDVITRRLIAQSTKGMNMKFLIHDSASPRSILSMSMFATRKDRGYSACGGYH